MHKRLVFNIIARMIFMICFALLAPLGWAAAENLYSPETNAFLVTILAGLLLGCLGRWSFPISSGDFEQMKTKDGLAVVGLTWIVLSGIGALPFWLSGAAHSFTDAYFEVASGLTTTGASIFTDIESLPRGLLFWRSLTHWLGGMGIVVLFVALLPLLSSNAFQLYKAEASGLTVDRAVPRLKENAKVLWLIYVFFSALCFVFLYLGGMSVFDALCHTFGAIATGGFSTKNAGMAAFGPYAQWVVTVFMFAGGVNFLLYSRLFQSRPLALFRDEEFRFFGLLVGVFGAGFAAVLWLRHVSEAPVRDAFFQVISILTATGFATRNFDLWPEILRGALLFLMFVGGCAGSTSGGLKVVRFLVALKLSVKSVTKAILPSLIVPVRINGTALPDKTVSATMTYFAAFVFMLAAGTMGLLVFDATDLVTAFSAALSALSSVGPGLGAVGPAANYAWISIPGKWVLIMLMLAGRLELYAILILFLPATWRK